jgi:hypothetical protein
VKHFFLDSVDTRSPLLVDALAECSSDDGMRGKSNLSAIHMLISHESEIEPVLVCLCHWYLPKPAACRVLFEIVPVPATDDGSTSGCTRVSI